MEHLFLYCPVARALWDYSGLEYVGKGLPRHKFPLFLKKLLALVHQPQLFMAVVAVLWRIWCSRNWVVFEGKQFGFPALMCQFHQQYEEWVGLPVEKAPQPSVLLGDNMGLDVPRGVVCMWGGAVRPGSHLAGGIVLLSTDRELLLVKGVQFHLLEDPMAVELLVLREAFLWCLGNGFTNVQFEGDAKVIIDKINQGEARDNRVGDVLEEVLHYFRIHTGLRIRFVGRRSNRVAHLVARKALSLNPIMSRFFDYQAWLNSRK
ncbi:unnamed protein product [Linum trigynum]|uniref:RNase H type-1 domain-containing protein n=1 Tax=Linum trigynum TaxID=586398 RepID=A0AAV2GSJ1_9ROSI